jgi:hypothetical protein
MFTSPDKVGWFGDVDYFHKVATGAEETREVLTKIPFHKACGSVCSKQKHGV